MQKSEETSNFFENEKEREKAEIRLYRILTATGQSQGEENLPDYRGEIRRVLFDEAEVIPERNDSADAGKTVEGNVQYRLYYLDGSDKLCVAEFSTPYEISLPIGEDERMTDSTVTLISSAVRPTGPRKISAKATLLASVTTCREREEEVKIEGDYAPELQKKNLSMSDFYTCDPTEREYAEQAEVLNGVSPSEVEIVSAGGNVRILGAKATAQGVMLTGAIDISCIVRIGESTPYSIGKTVPFEELIPYGTAPDAGSGDSLFTATNAQGVLTSVRADVSADGSQDGKDGESAVLTVSAIAEFRAGAVANRVVSTVTDAYVQGAACKVEEEEILYEEFTAKGSERVSVTQSIPAQTVTDAAGLHNILRTYAFVPSYEAQPAEEGVRIRGKVLFFALADRITDEGKTLYSVQRAEAEFVENVKMSGQIYPNSSIVYRVTPENASSVLNGDNVDFSAELRLDVLAFTPRRCRRITEITAEEGTERKSENTVTVFYPGKGDTLWSVAKHYGKSVKALAAQNRLTEDQRKAADTPASLQGVVKLLIL